MLCRPIPSELGKCIELQSLGLYENQLSGKVPTYAIAALRKVKRIGLHGNASLRVMQDDKTHLERLLGSGVKIYWPRVDATVQSPSSAPAVKRHEKRTSWWPTGKKDSSSKAIREARL